MASASTITLFTERRDPGPGVLSFFGSAVLHTLGIGGIAYVILTAPRVVDHHLDRMAVRHVELRQHDYPPPVAKKNAKQAPGAKPATSGGKNQQAKNTSSPPPMRRHVADAEPGPNTLVEPEMDYRISLDEDTPIPSMVIWTPHQVVVKNIVAPEPATPTAAEVRPTNVAPNEEINLGDQGLTAAKLASDMQLFHPTTTSPITVHGPDQPQMAPQTVAQTGQTPTPAAVLSLSNVRMADGMVTLPPANQSAEHDSEGTLNGIRQGAEEGNGMEVGGQQSTTLIRLPENGYFGSVVVGAGVEDQFPEIAEVWHGRLAYTVYLHVGLAKNWLLQYSIPADDEAAAGGNLGKLEAPWPYSIVRPNLAADAIDADAVLIHGFLNENGRFEKMKVAFPLHLAQAGFLLNAIEQWQFRPATREGQVTRVEVLLIIPEAED